MEEVPEKEMDSIAYFKSGKLIGITGRQTHVGFQTPMVNLLAVSNRFGYVFYATQSEGIALIPSTYIDRESRYLSKSSEDDDDDDDNENNVNENPPANILRRSCLPGGNRANITPYWIALNADETILAMIVLQSENKSWNLIFYDVTNFIRSDNSSPLCSPFRLGDENNGGTISNFSWNPAIPTSFAYLNEEGTVAIMEIDVTAKRLNLLGKCQPNNDHSSICWSPKGKQLVSVTFDGILQSYDLQMQMKTKYNGVLSDRGFPPCISVVWLSTYQFLLGFAEDEAGGNGYFQVLLTYEKDQKVKSLMYPDLFYDITDELTDLNSQYYYARVNDWKITMCGVTKSLKIAVLGSNELNEDFFDTWTFADQYRAFVQGINKSNEPRPILSGMAIGLNSTLKLAEGSKKLSPSPILLLSNSEGVLQVFYFVHRSLPSICRSPEKIPVKPPPEPVPSSNTNGSSLPTPIAPAKEKSSQPVISSNTTPTNDFFSSARPAAPGKVPTSKIDNPKLLQKLEQFQAKLDALLKPLPQQAAPPNEIHQSLDLLHTKLKEIGTAIQSWMKTIKTMISEHIEAMSRIETVRHQMKSSQKENLHHKLKDRELDPWTQSRLDSIQSRLDQIKHQFNVLLQLTHSTIHDKSLSSSVDEENDNEDFLPDLEISLNNEETMRQRLQRRIKELGHKVKETEKDMNSLCSKMKPLSLDNQERRSQIIDTTYVKTPSTSSKRSYHSSDAQLLAYLKANHPKPMRISIPSATSIEITPMTNQTRSSTIEMPQTLSSITSKESTPAAPPPEEVQNMMRVVRTAIDLFAGATSPDQLRELANAISQSPISKAPTSNRTPTSTKTTPMTKTSTQIPTNKQTTSILTSSPTTFQTPSKSVASPIPTISVTPATPATQGIALEPAIKAPAIKTAPVAPAPNSDSSIRSLLGNQNSTPVPASNPLISSVVNQQPKQGNLGQAPGFSMSSTTTAIPTSTFAFGGLSSPATTITTSVQSTSPTTKALTPADPAPFGSKAGLGIAPSNLSSTVGFNFSNAATNAGSPFGNLTPTTTSATSATATTTTSSTSFFGVAPAATITTSAGASFSNPTTSTTTTNAAPSPFGNGFSLSISGAPSTPINSPFGTNTTSASSSVTGTFGSSSMVPITSTASSPSPFGVATSTPSGIFGNSGSSIFVGGAAAPSTTSSSIFGSSGTGFGAPATTSTSSSSFGAAPALSSPLGGSFGAPAASPSSGSIFGGFGSTPTPATSAPSGSVFSGFGNINAPTTSAPSSSSTFGGFGSTPTSTTSAPTASGFGSTGAFSFKSTAPVASTAPTSGSSSLFGSSASNSGSGFGTGFSGFGQTSGSTGVASNGFSFGGFGAAAPSPAANPSPGFGGFGSAASPAAQPGSTFGASPFGSTSPQAMPGGFGGTTSSFGAPAAAPGNSPSFTTYRK